VGLLDNPTVSVRLPRFFEQLMSAQAKADDLARKTFDHTCQPTACGEWLPVPANSDIA
jgi:hypothetical protein